jgi:outer membrane protein
MTSRPQTPARATMAAMAAMATQLACGAASAQDNVVKIGITEYTTHSKSNGISGIGVPAGADAKTGNATTVVLVYERMLTPNLGAEIVLGIPPKIQADAAGSVAFLGDNVLSARIVAPTFFVNYHFNAPGDTWRPYLGAGVNYTKFVRIESKLASDVKMSDSVGWAAQAGVDYMLNRDWSLFASVAVLQVRSKVVAAGSTVLQTTIDFRPIVYTVGAGYRF